MQKYKRLRSVCFRRLSIGALAWAGLAGAHADAVFSFDPFVVAVPDSRGFSNSTSSSSQALVGALAAPHGFLDTWAFHLATGALVGGFVGSFNLADAGGQATQGIQNLEFRLVGPGGPLVGAPFVTNWFGFQQVLSVASPAPFAAGDYALEIRGQLVGPTSSYGGTLTTVSAVPLPAALPLMASGLFLLGGLARRKDLRPRL